jgi:hypothetical protein
MNVNIVRSWHRRAGHPLFVVVVDHFVPLLMPFMEIGAFLYIPQGVKFPKVRVDIWVEWVDYSADCAHQCGI